MSLEGMQESVRDGVDGLLFERGDDTHLAELLRRLSDEPRVLEHLKAGIRPVKTIGEEVKELVTIYSELVSR